eukprot:CAMPEP_0174907108 /NCGR_PEP_ID=MMETSP0167-20121228/59550_1 /TAXON_ID=38298 /ORGANISM="Rhodella maculata, Strain CCMP736" /LENGTH=459 /DNA_ID=CAMNT_0016150505 /DNA_START=64 /DNA_END=1443 /DNA_ORIENTATION=-
MPRKTAASTLVAPAAPTEAMSTMSTVTAESAAPTSAPAKIAKSKSSKSAKPAKPAEVVSENAPPLNTPAALSAEMQKLQDDNASLSALVSSLTSQLNTAKVSTDSQSTALNSSASSRATTASAAPSSAALKYLPEPDAPKRATSAYIFYSINPEIREAVKAAMPAAEQGNNKALVAALAESWNKATPEEKAPFHAMAAEDKARHDKEMAAFMPGKKARDEERKRIEAYLNEERTAAALAYYEENVENKVKKTKKDPDMPKGKSSAYNCFMKDRFAAVKASGVAPNEVLKVISEEWAKANKKTVAKYEKLAAADKLRYDAEMEEYNVRLAERNADEAVAYEEIKEKALEREKKEKAAMNKVIRAEVKTKVEVAAKKAAKEQKKEEKKDKVKKPMSAYNVFVKANYETVKAKMGAEAGFAEVSGEVSKMWKELDAEKKKPFEEGAALDKERYDREVAEKAC